MNVIWHWVPTLSVAAVLAIYGFCGLWKLERDERRAKQDQAGKPTGSQASR